MEGKEQIRLLMELQGVETDLTALNKRQKQNVKAKTHFQAEITTGETLLAKGAEELAELRKSYREMESDTRAATDQVRKLNAKLNMVKTNKEYHALLKEIDEIKREISKTEDRMLAHLDQVEVKEATLKGQEEQHSQNKVKADQECVNIDRDDAQCRDRLAKLNKTRQSLMDKLPPPQRSMYERVVKGQSNGLAVAPVVNAVCGGCNVNIPPQMFNELQRCDTVKLCPSCQRIIYWPSCCE